MQKKHLDYKRQEIHQWSEAALECTTMMISEPFGDPKEEAEEKLIQVWY